MTESRERAALVVRGGWDGHVPEAATDEFIPFLRDAGFAVQVSDSLAVYADAARLRRFDLIVGCWTMGEIAAEQAAGLVDAVGAGTGFAGWHGGIVDAFRGSPDYQRLTGGQFLYHPSGFLDYSVQVHPERTDHAIVAGLERIDVSTEKYWVLTDSANDVLATVTFEAEPDTPWSDSVTMPAVWTRRWGAGRVFVSTIGHRVEDLRVPGIRTITERGLLWAAR